MPVFNIIDSRSNHYDVECMVIFEDSWHDNCISGASQAEVAEKDKEIMYISIGKTSISIALEYARQEWQNHDVTMYLYDICSDNYIDYESIQYINGRWETVNKVNK